MISDLAIEPHDGRAAAALADELGALYAAAYIGTPQENDPFYSAARFAERLNGYIKSPGFALVTARTGADLIGYAFGYALPVGARWWNGLLDTPPEGFTTETGTRTFALNELHVRADCRGSGVASALHSKLLESGQYERATVLVRPENPALSLYRHWGYREIGKLKPYPDSPIYLAMVLQLLRQPDTAS
jgi:ribosomal protein S18 acetylase RimI-like enzyme